MLEGVSRLARTKLRLPQIVEAEGMIEVSCPVGDRDGWAGLLQLAHCLDKLPIEQELAASKGPIG